MLSALAHGHIGHAQCLHGDQYAVDAPAQGQNAEIAEHEGDLSWGEMHAVSAHTSLMPASSVDSGAIGIAQRGIGGSAPGGICRRAFACMRYVPLQGKMLLSPTVTEAEGGDENEEHEESVGERCGCSSKHATHCSCML